MSKSMYPSSFSSVKYYLPLLIIQKIQYESGCGHLVLLSGTSAILLGSNNSSPGLAVWTNRLVPLIPSRVGITEILTHWLHAHAAGSSQSVNHLMEQFLPVLCSPALWCHFLQASILFDKPQIAVSLSHYFDKYFIFILLIDSSAFLLTQGVYKKKWKIKRSCLTTLLGIDTL